MSRIGRKSIALPPGVKVASAGGEVRAEGPKGKLSMSLAEGIDVAVNAGATGEEIVITRASEERHLRAMHGTTRALIANMVTGVSTGFTKVLELWGVGYNAAVKGTAVTLNVGYCHAVEVPIPSGLSVETERASVEGTNIWRITVTGIDRQAVGQLAAEIRKTRPPEPYKGKGIRYQGERILRKAGKSFTSGAGG
jgi:large subunit ribosomal protein L6